MGKVLLRSAPSAGGDVNGEKPRLYIQFNSSYMLYIYIYIYIYIIRQKCTVKSNS